MIGSAEPIIAIAVILSALVSLIGTGARKQAVLEGRARAADLCELTGILEPRVLQDVFGPPTMDGFYTTTLERVKQARQPLGLIISEDRADIACIVVAVATFLTSHPISDLVLMIAAAYQTAGWFISVRLPEKK